MGLKSSLFVAFALFCASLAADPFPPEWSGGAGAAIHYDPVAWPSEPANPLDCGHNCGGWKPYTRFQNDIADARTKDVSNGGTAPQSYVNVASSCADKTLPSIYYYLHRGATAADDVLMFRWRVEAGPHNYATGPSAGTYSATNPWSSAMWTVFFDLSGGGYRSLAAHLDGSIGGPAEPVDRLAGIWGNSASHSLDYANDPNVHLLGHNPTAFVGPTGKLLNFQSSLTATENWPNGSAETTWDYGTTRAKLVSKNSCSEYFVDYQIPIAMLDASSLGGPSISRSTPISMMFCTANSLNNPLQKDCAVQKEWLASTGVAAPFGDYLSFDQTEPYSQPIIAEVQAVAPAICPGSYRLTTKVQDTLALANGAVQPSVQAVDFYYWFDANGDGAATAADAGSTWTKIAGTASLVSGTLNTWSASWNATALRKGRYVVAVQAVDDNTKVDDGMTASGVNNRTFSYLSGDATNVIYRSGAWATGQQAAFPSHSPAQTPSTAENWFGNPDVTGNQVAAISTAVNVCGLAPTILQSVDKNEVGAGGNLSFTTTVTNPAANGESVTVSSFSNQLPDGFAYVGGSSTGATTSDPTAAGQLLTWNLGAPVTLAPGASTSITFSATASTLSGVYNNIAGAATSFESLQADPLAVAVDSVRLALSLVPDTFSVAADNTDTITFTLHYANDSTVTVYAGTLTTAVAADTTYVSCTGGASCSLNAGTVTWNLGDIPPGYTGSVSYSLRVGTTWATPSLTTTANLAGTDAANNPVTATASTKVAVTGIAAVATPAAFTLRNTASAIQIAPGATVTYTLAYQNYGETGANSVVLTDTLPAGMTYGSCSGGCSVAGSTVTWNLGSVAANGSGRVTVTATSASPFTSPNPTTNSASISWTGGTPVTATAGVGVTGQACNSYYFSDTTGNVGSDGTRRLALLTPVPTAATTGSSVTVTAPGKTTNTFVEALRFYQDPATASDVPFSGDITTSIYIDRANGPALNLRASVYDYNSTDGTKVLLGQNNPLAEGQFGGSSKGLLSVTVPTSGTLAKDHRLLWVFEAQSNHNTTTYSVQFQYGGTVTNAISGGTTVALSGASFCVTPPANLIVATTASLSDLDAGSTQSVVYTINYANTGAVSTTNSTLLNTLPSGFTACEYSTNSTTWAACSNAAGQAHSFSLGTIAGGTSGTVYVRGNAPAGSTGGTSLTNTSTISSTQTSAKTVTTSVAVNAAAAGGSAELAVSYRASTTSLVPGDTVTFSVTVTNTGSTTASNTSVSNVLPVADYFSYVSCSDSCNSSGNSITWATGSLAAGASRTYTYTMLAGSTNLTAGVTTITDDLTATADTLSAVTSNAVSLSLSGNPQLDLDVAAVPNAGLAPGSTITYTLTATNQGSVAASGVQVFDPIPADTLFAGAVTTSSGTAAFDAVNNRLVFNAGTLAPGATATASFAVTVSGDLPNGNTTITNTASAAAANAQQVTAQVTAVASAAAQLTLTHSQSASSAYPTAQLTASATAAAEISVDHSGRFSLGQQVQIGGGLFEVIAVSGSTITLDAAVTAASGSVVIGAVAFSISYVNTGDAAAHHVELTESLPAGLTYSSAEPAADSAPTVGSTGDLVWSLGTLAPGQSGSVAVIAFPSGTTGAHSTTATLEASDAGTVAASVTTTIGGLSVSKTTSTPLLNAGDTASYTITLTNSLASGVTGVALADLLPQGFRYSAGSARVGGVASEPGFAMADTQFAQPEWTNLTVPAAGTLAIEFDAEISADTGAGTYQNELRVIPPAGVGLQDFDPLATATDDVTVLAADEGSIAGYVFNRVGASGTTYVRGDDLPLEGVRVEIYQDGADCSDPFGSGCFVRYTDPDGYFSQVAPAGTWSIKVSENTGELPSGWLQLVGANDDEFQLTPQAQVVDHNGFGVLTGTSQVSDVSKTVAEDSALAFATSDFTAAFVDVNGGNNLATLRIDSLPGNGTLTLNGAAVAVNDQIAAADLATLVYTPDADFNGADSFLWNGTDGLAYDSNSADVLITVTDSADPGSVSNFSRTVAEETALNFTANDFQGAFTDTNGGSNLVQIRIDSLPGNGTLVLSGNNVAANDVILAADIGNLVYTPNANYVGADSFTWNAYDGTFYAGSAAAVNITVTDTADPGTVSNFSRTVAEETTLNFAASDFQGSFTDSNGGSNLVQIRIDSLPGNGTLTLAGNSVAANDVILAADIGNLVYTPNANYFGADSFTWNAYDGTFYAGSAAAVNITVTDTADPGTVDNINRTVAEDASLNFTSGDFQGAFTDSNGGSNLVQIRIDSLPGDGVLTLAGNGVAANDVILAADIGDLVYTPNANYFGPDSFTWNAYDGAFYASSAATVSITVTDTVDPGTVNDFARTVAEDAALNFTSSDFQAAFTDSNGGSNLVRVTIESLPAHGSLTLDGNAIAVGDEIVAADLADLTYTPVGNYFGADSFQWNAYDGTLYAAAAATVNITVTAVADPGSASDFNRTVAEDASLGFSSADFAAAFTDANGGHEFVHIRIDSLPVNGTLTLNGQPVAEADEIATADIAGLVYTPDADYFGSDSFVWNAFDGALYASSAAAVQITVTNTADAGSVVDFNRTVAEDAALPFTASDFQAAFTDYNGGSNLVHIRIDSLPAHGTLTLGGAAVAAHDVIAVADLAELVYTPAANYNGPDVFTWNAHDGTLYASSPAAVNITVTEVADPGSVAHFNRTVAEDAALDFTGGDFQAAFTDSNGGSYLVQIRIDSLPAHGLLTLAGGPVAIGDVILAAAIDDLVYTPADDYFGADGFNWNAYDGTLYAANSATVNITVTDTAEPGSVSDFSRTLDEETALTFTTADFRAVFTDSNGGDNLVHIRVLSLPTHGSLTLAGSPVAVNDDITATNVNSLTYTPAPNYSGTDSFLWNAFDGALYAAAPAAVNLTVTARVDAGEVTVNNFARNLAEDAVLTFTTGDFLAAFTDSSGGGNLVQVRVESLPAQGTLTMGGALGGTPVAAGDILAAVDLSALTYTPAANFTGADTWLWNASDGSLYATHAASVLLNITPVADAPTVADFGRTLAEDTALDFTGSDFANAFSDADADNLAQVRIDSLPAHGTLTLYGFNVAEGDTIAWVDLGFLSYAPDGNFTGADTFTWNASDGSLYAAASAAVTLTVTEVADPGSVTDFARTLDEDTSLIFNVIDFTNAFVDSNGGSNLVQIRIDSLPMNGILSLGGAAVQMGDEIPAANLATLVYTPTTDYSGPDDFVWNAYDGSFYAATGAQVSLSVQPVADPGEVVVLGFAKTVAEDTALNFTAGDFLAGFTDSSGGNNLVQVRIDSLPNHGLLTLAGNPVAINYEILAADINNLVYTPVANYFGADSFSWNASDGILYAASSASASITISDVPDPGTTISISRTVAEDATLNFTGGDFRAAFTDSNGGNQLVHLRIDSLPSHGALSLAGNPVVINDVIPAADLNNLAYTPAADYFGADSFTWNAFDGSLYAANSATVNITVTDTADPGSVSPFNRTVVEDATLNFTSGDFQGVFTDSNGGSHLVHIRIDSLPGHGALALAGDGVAVGQIIPAAAIGDLAYIPAADYFGSDGFTWNAFDGALYAVSATSVNITVTEVADPGTAESFERTVAEDGELNFTLDDFRNAFTDANGGHNLQRLRLLDLPAVGVLTLNGAAVPVNSEISAEDLNRLVYTPTPNYNGPDNFRWLAFDGQLYATAPARVQIAVVEGLDPGQVTDFARTVAEEEVLEFAAEDFAAVFVDATGGHNLVGIRVLSLPANGTLTVAGAAVSLNDAIGAVDLERLVYRPNVDYNGADQFLWTADDGLFEAATPARVLITVAAIADPGQVSNFSRVVAEDTLLRFTTEDFRAAFTDSNGGHDLFWIRIEDLPQHGSLSLAGDPITSGDQILAEDLAQLEYRPAPDYFGPDEFRWIAYDGALESASAARVLLAVTSVADPGTVTDIERTLAEGNDLTFTAADFRNAFVDSNGGRNLAQVRLVSLPAHGQLSLRGAAVVTNDVLTAVDLAELLYRPAGGYNGLDSFQWNASDGALYAAAPASVRLTITAMADPGSVTGFARSLVAGGSLMFRAEDFAAEFVDSNGGHNLVGIRLDALPEHGTLTLDGQTVSAGQEVSAGALAGLAYTPAAVYHGSDNIRWSGFDGALYSANSASVALTVTQVAAPGSVRSFARVLPEDGSLSFQENDFRAAFTDANGGANLVRVRIDSLPIHGELALDGILVAVGSEITALDLGRLVYTPAANFHGADSFLWHAYDGQLYSATAATVNLTVIEVADPGTVTGFARSLPEDGELTFTTDEFAAAFTGTLVRMRLETLPAHGALTLMGVDVAAGDEINAADLETLVYLPDANYHGADTFTWRAHDGTLFSANTATVSLTVAPVVDPGSLEDFAKTLMEDTALAFTTGDFLEAFRDGYGGQNLVHIRIDTLPQRGALSLDGDPVAAGDTIPAAGINSLVYTPAGNYFGADGFSWNAFDGEAYAGSAATVALSITPVADGAPIVEGETTIHQGEAAVLDVLASLPAGTTIVSARSSYGSVAVVNNQLEFTPDPTLSGVAEVVYLVRDAAGYLSEGSVLVNITGNGNAPDVTPPPDKVANADALYTKLDLGLAAAIDRFGNPLPVSLVDGVTFFEPGLNRAFWETVDAEGNRRVEMQRVRVRPLVSIQKDQQVLEGRPARIGVYLNGPSPEYPLVILYSVTGTAGAADHTLVNGELILAAGTEAYIDLEILGDALADGGETLLVALSPTLNRGDKALHTLTIVEGNVAPEVDLSATQNGERRLLITRAANAGPAVLTSATTDANPDDQHTYAWLVQRGTAADQDAAAETFTLDPAALAVGLYILEVTVTDNGAPPLSDTATVYLDVVEALPALTLEADSDQDLIPDATEGNGDSDGDGIPNYQDSRDECNVLHEGVAEQKAYLIEGDPGVCLRKGFFTVDGESGGAQITAGDFSRPTNRLEPDVEATNIGGIFDYISYGLPESGQSYRVVLPQRLPIPELAVYRKFLGGSWGFFVEDGVDGLASAPGEQGFCPPPGGAVWQPGLTPGHWCVQLTIRDGGPNDDDGLPNGVVVDPGGVAVMNAGNAPPQTVDRTVSGAFGTSVTLDVLADATDPDGDDLTLLSASADLGSVTINADGTLTYTPPAGFAGTATLTYSVGDGSGGVAVGRVTVTIQPAQTAPPRAKLRTRGGATPWLLLLLLGAVGAWTRPPGGAGGRR